MTSNVSVGASGGAGSSGASGATSGQSSPGPGDAAPGAPPHPLFHQHGDVGFCELPLEPDSGVKLGSVLLLKHSAQRSYSSNPRVRTRRSYIDLENSKICALTRKFKYF